MRSDTPLAVVWRHKWIIIVTVVVFVATTAILSKSLEKVYSTSSTLLVSVPAETQSFDTVQASQAVARSYADIVESPNVAQLVATRLGGGTTSGEVLEATTFEAIAETQLLEITVENSDPARAKEIADTYANVVIGYADQRLTDTTKADVSIADAAPLPQQPARPKPLLYTLLAAVLGLALGLALAFLRDQLDHRLRTSQDVETRFDVPVLGRVPRRGRSDSSVSAFREAHRILRTNLDFATGGEKLRSIAVVSGGEGEGKTTTVAQLALASAEVGLHVLAVEADLRRPALERELEPNRTEPRRPGLSNYLVEASTREQVIHPTGRPNLDIVPAGPLPPSPSALLEARRGRTAIADFLEQADLVLIDCPPLSVGADASILSGWADGVIVVVDLDRSTDNRVRSALRQLEAVRASVTGLVLNRDRHAEVSKYDQYYQAVSKAARDGKVQSETARERV